MIFGKRPQGAFKVVMAAWAAVMLALAPQTVLAQDAVAPEAVSTEVASSDAAATEPAAGTGYKPMGPEMIKGQPTSADEDIWASIDFQKQYTDDGQYAHDMHTYLLMPVITVISLFVLALLMWVVLRFRRSANPVPSKTTHNTPLEVVWTLVPVLILVAISIPSITLLARQYETPPADAVTIKATGYQWYWGYTYPDNGGFEVISNMMPEEDAIAAGLPAQLAVDKRMVVPANTPLRIQTTAADVIHAFAVPSLWFKIDAVPGKLNERLLTINEPGIYYGQCSELCGARHGFMPIAVEALPREEWEAWVIEQGGTVGEEPAAEEAAAEPASINDEAEDVAENTGDTSADATAAE